MVQRNPDEKLYPIKMITIKVQVGAGVGRAGEHGRQPRGHTFEAVESCFSFPNTKALDIFGYF